MYSRFASRDGSGENYALVYTYVACAFSISPEGHLAGSAHKHACGGRTRFPAKNINKVNLADQWAPTSSSCPRSLLWAIATAIEK